MVKSKLSGYQSVLHSSAVFLAWRLQELLSECAEAHVSPTLTITEPLFAKLCCLSSQNWQKCLAQSLHLLIQMQDIEACYNFCKRDSVCRMFFSWRAPRCAKAFEWVAVSNSFNNTLLVLLLSSQPGYFLV